MKMSAISIAAILAGCGTEPEPDNTVGYKGRDKQGDALIYAPYIPIAFASGEKSKLNIEEVSGSHAKSSMKFDDNKNFSIDTNWLEPEKSKVYYKQNILKF